MTTADRYYRAYVEERYCILRGVRRVYFRKPTLRRLWADNPLRDELRSLVRCRWFVRRQVRKDRLDPRKSFHDGQAA